MFESILIANRGEIAARIIQTCREMGIRTVAVYSAADKGALHVGRAHEAYCVGPAPALESYLSKREILQAADKAGVEAVHPGYGFLAENPEFARMVLDAGLAWIGPPPAVIALLGDKVASKELARSAGVPVVPGYFGEDQSQDRMIAEAERVGYPVMLKAAAGGGGKGMRAVSRSDDLPAALEGARREARSAFGDDRVFLEKLLSHPRHVEAQVLADAHGNALHLGERDCSIQRRHQKVVEESPSPALTPDLRHALGEAALRLIRRAGYVNAGTVEFLFSGDEFYFLEVNTRIQVEHPVTEMRTGFDLVRLQLEIASGARLPMSQLDIHPRGHAIEARLYAEDPQNDFLPAVGTLAAFEPPGGPGVRNDVGVVRGAEIGPYYDPLLGKLIVHAESREYAVERLREALDRFLVLGVTTNLEFLRWVSRHQDFVAGRVDTGFVERNWRPQEEAELPEEVLMAAACFELSEGESEPDDRRGPEAYNPWRRAGSWRTAGSARVFTYEYAGAEMLVEGRRSGAGWHLVLRSEAHDVEVQRSRDGRIVLLEGPRVLTFGVARCRDSLLIDWHGVRYTLRPPSRSSGTPATAASSSTAEGLTAPMPGTVVKIAVTEGQEVSAHEALVVLEAMKMEHVVEAPHDGVVEKILVDKGDLVSSGAPVITLGPR